MNPAALAAALNGDLKNALVASTPGGIEAQEKAGQTALVTSTNMPLDLQYYADDDVSGRERFEKLGFTFGAAIDDVFQEATLPAGWTRRPTDHSMWSEICDADGNVRATVFYKAAFYDRNAFASLVARFKFATDYSDDREREIAESFVFITDKDKVIWKSEIYKRFDYAAKKAASSAGQEWLSERYPDYQDPTAYWDMPVADTSNV